MTNIEITKEIIIKLIESNKLATVDAVCEAFVKVLKTVDVATNNTDINVTFNK